MYLVMKMGGENNCAGGALAINLFGSEVCLSIQQEPNFFLCSKRKHRS
jgi:hypothetical protein